MANPARVQPTPISTAEPVFKPDDEGIGDGAVENIGVCIEPFGRSVSKCTYLSVHAKGFIYRLARPDQYLYAICVDGAPVVGGILYGCRTYRLGNHRGQCPVCKRHVRFASQGKLVRPNRVLLAIEGTLSSEGVA